MVLLLEGELHYKLMILAAFSYIQTNHLLNLVISEWQLWVFVGGQVQFPNTHLN